MRFIKILLFVSLFAGCSDNADDQNVQDVVLEPVVTDTGNIVPDSTQSRLGWLDSLQSDDVAVRLSAFQRYKKTRASSDGDASEMLSGYLKTYVYSHPKEFLSSYSFMNPTERVNAQTDIAYQIYASSNKQYKRDIEEYFSDITKSCEDCSADLKRLLKDFRSKVEMRVTQFAK